jgi:hypothetical protein
MTNKPRTPLSIAFPAKGAAEPRSDVSAASDPQVSAGPTAEATGTRPVAAIPKLKLEPRLKNEYAALTIRPGPERRTRLEQVSAETGRSMQDILLACFDAFYPPVKIG